MYIRAVERCLHSSEDSQFVTFLCHRSMYSNAATLQIMRRWNIDRSNPPVFGISLVLCIHPRSKGYCQSGCRFPIVETRWGRAIPCEVPLWIAGRGYFEVEIGTQRKAEIKYDALDISRANTI